MTDVYMIHNSYNRLFTKSFQDDLLISCLYEDKISPNSTLYHWKRIPLDCTIEDRQCFNSSIGTIINYM